MSSAAPTATCSEAFFFALKKHKEQNQTHCESPGGTLDGQHRAHDTADTPLDVGSAHVHGQLGADEALHDQGQGQGYGSTGCSREEMGIRASADKGTPAEGTGTGVGGLHGLGALPCTRWDTAAVTAAHRGPQVWV